MKLRPEFILHEDGQEGFIIPSGKANFSGVIRGNKSFSSIVKLLQSDTTEAEIINAMREKYNAPEGIIESDVKKVIENLREIGALID